MARKPLNPRQVEVLQWIADGCPDRDWPDFTYKHTAVALQGRRLAKVSKRGGWHADITEVGRYYLEHQRYPGEDPKKIVSRTKQVRIAPPEPEPGPVVIDAREDTLSGTDLGAETNASEEQVESPEPVSVPIPEQLRRPHEVIVQLRDDKTRFAITGPARRRALLIAQGLILACEREGWTARPVDSHRDGYGRTIWEAKHHFWIDTGECKVGVIFVQEKDRAKHEPTAYELAQKKRHEWTRIPEYDYSPSERLKIELGYGYRTNYSDGKRMALVSKLSAIITTIRDCHETSLARRLEQERREAERAEQWRAAMVRAKVLLTESHRSEELIRQARDWRQARELREYVEALETATSTLGETERIAAAGWIEWARAACERLDPLNKTIQMPEDPEPTSEALKPFLGVWSPYGPRGW